ncbi:MAG: hypothetical protein A3I31_02105 [Candidatus Colwellbacteria bacterium RIFCSPLOWO2_02_FULL_44_20b]|uniref:DNA replication/recombination mediator RecO N-terminal domain-containing protein n=1 Tax=Candidatus Colwellbacteria bacterium RIFCSPLOWO2_02_FULL_44_20b TaxID=1797691 RepID=A0A1G1Z8K5_9BACT|nr:MAG: hypothetical protein A3I31_02105 [Candidatus Colwellbacteria bacterium RIFCSPLOWO2_02_FULL_44_20b]
MTELYTEAIVLGKEKRGDIDSTVILYSKSLGKIRAFVKSARKITSKLSPHLEPGMLVRARLIQGEKRGGNFQVADVLSEERYKEAEAVKMLRFANDMTAEGEEDIRFWQALKLLLKEKRFDPPAYQLLLHILGFSTQTASCNRCHSKKVDYFITDEVLFLCRPCSRILNIPEEKAISI